IEVTFDIDANGIVNVSAKDLGTGKEQAITITSSSGVAEDEIKRMVHDAEEHAEEDKKRREIVEARNHADTLAYGTEKILKEHESKVSEAERKEIQDAVAEVRKVLEDQNASLERITQARGRLESASHKLAQAMYQKAGQAADGGASRAPRPEGPAKPAAEGDVVDAEFEEVDKEKK
ncbi:MAG: Hsp70 family protein, partial [Candidatus Tectomicrobia bacterium]|nr:Hsp70 family protein [Candidatus Tectomicrobia bacterium]